MDEHYIFLGCEWLQIDVALDGHIAPLPRGKCTDVLRVKTAYHLGPNVYSVLNVSQRYQCFVQVKRAGQAKYVRCNHENCHWQSLVKRPWPCKHERAAVKWHVNLMARLRAKKRRLGL